MQDHTSWPDTADKSQRQALSPDGASPEDEGAAAAPSSAKRALIFALKVIVSAVLLVVLFSRVDTARLWSSLRTASIVWLTAALGLYLVMILVSAWRWGLLLRAQDAPVRAWTLVASWLVATFFNNFLPSNIGGDVIRIRDTSKPTGSKTLATTIVLIDRGIGLLALVLIAAVGSSAMAGETPGPIGPGLLWLAFVGGAIAVLVAVERPGVLERMLSPLRVFHPEWVEERLGRITGALGRFRQRPGALIGGAIGALVTQGVLVAFYGAIAYSMRVPVSPAHLAVIVPVSFLVQMIPISVNGFGVREATFVFYFKRLGLPAESALLVSFVGAALVMLFSLSGAAVYMTRRA